MKEFLDTILTLIGDYDDPGINLRLNSIIRKLVKILSIGKSEFRVKTVEPWNSVRLTFNIPKNAALKLSRIASSDGQRMQLQELGILSVHIQGHSNIPVCQNYSNTTSHSQITSIVAPSTSYSHLNNNFHSSENLSILKSFNEPSTSYNFSNLEKPDFINKNNIDKLLDGINVDNFIDPAELSRFKNLEELAPSDIIKEVDSLNISSEINQNLKFNNYNNRPNNLTIKNIKRFNSPYYNHVGDDVRFDNGTPLNSFDKMQIYGGNMTNKIPNNHQFAAAAEQSSAFVEINKEAYATATTSKRKHLITNLNDSSPSSQTTPFSLQNHLNLADPVLSSPLLVNLLQKSMSNNSNNCSNNINSSFVYNKVGPNINASHQISNHIYNNNTKRNHKNGKHHEDLLSPHHHHYQQAHNDISPSNNPSCYNYEGGGEHTLRYNSQISPFSPFLQQQQPKRRSPLATLPPPPSSQPPPSLFCSINCNSSINCSGSNVFKTSVLTDDSAPPVNQDGGGIIAATPADSCLAGEEERTLLMHSLNEFQNSVVKHIIMQSCPPPLQQQPPQQRQLQAPSSNSYIYSSSSSSGFPSSFGKTPQQADDFSMVDYYQQHLNNVPQLVITPKSSYPNMAAITGSSSSCSQSRREEIDSSQSRRDYEGVAEEQQQYLGRNRNNNQQVSGGGLYNERAVSSSSSLPFQATINRPPYMYDVVNGNNVVNPDFVSTNNICDKRNFNYNNNNNGGPYFDPPKYNHYHHSHLMLLSQQQQQQQLNHPKINYPEEYYGGNGSEKNSSHPHHHPLSSLVPPASFYPKSYPSTNNNLVDGGNNNLDIDNNKNNGGGYMHQFRPPFQHQYQQLYLDQQQQLRQQQYLMLSAGAAAPYHQTTTPPPSNEATFKLQHQLGNYPPPPTLVPPNPSNYYYENGGDFFSALSSGAGGVSGNSIYYDNMPPPPSVLGHNNAKEVNDPNPITVRNMAAAVVTPKSSAASTKKQRGSGGGSGNKKNASRMACSKNNHVTVSTTNNQSNSSAFVTSPFPQPSCLTTLSNSSFSHSRFLGGGCYEGTGIHQSSTYLNTYNANSHQYTGEGTKETYCGYNNNNPNTKDVDHRFYEEKEPLPLPIISTSSMISNHPTPPPPYYAATTSGSNQDHHLNFTPLQPPFYQTTTTPHSSFFGDTVLSLSSFSSTRSSSSIGGFNELQFTDYPPPLFQTTADSNNNNTNNNRLAFSTLYEGSTTLHKTTPPPPSYLSVGTFSNPTPYHPTNSPALVDDFVFTATTTQVDKNALCVAAGPGHKTSHHHHYRSTGGGGSKLNSASPAAKTISSVSNNGSGLGPGSHSAKAPLFPLPSSFSTVTAAITTPVSSLTITEIVSLNLAAIKNAMSLKNVRATIPTAAAATVGTNNSNVASIPPHTSLSRATPAPVGTVGSNKVSNSHPPLAISAPLSATPFYAADTLSNSNNKNWGDPRSASSSSSLRYTPHQATTCQILSQCSPRLTHAASSYPVYSTTTSLSSQVQLDLSSSNSSCYYSAPQAAPVNQNTPPPPLLNHPIIDNINNNNNIYINNDSVNNNNNFTYTNPFPNHATSSSAQQYQLLHSYINNHPAVTLSSGNDYCWNPSAASMPTTLVAYANTFGHHATVATNSCKPPSSGKRKAASSSNFNSNNNATTSGGSGNGTSEKRVKKSAVTAASSSSSRKSVTVVSQKALVVSSTAPALVLRPVDSSPLITTTVMDTAGDFTVTRDLVLQRQTTTYTRSVISASSSDVGDVLHASTTPVPTFLLEDNSCTTVSLDHVVLVEGGENDAHHVPSLPATAAISNTLPDDMMMMQHHHPNSPYYYTGSVTRGVDDPLNFGGITDGGSTHHATPRPPLTTQQQHHQQQLIVGLKGATASLTELLTGSRNNNYTRELGDDNYAAPPPYTTPPLPRPSKFPFSNHHTEETPLVAAISSSFSTKTTNNTPISFSSSAASSLLMHRPLPPPSPPPILQNESSFNYMDIDDMLSIKPTKSTDFCGIRNNNNNNHVNSDLLLQQQQLHNCVDPNLNHLTVIPNGLSISFADSLMNSTVIASVVESQLVTKDPMCNLLNSSSSTSFLFQQQQQLLPFPPAVTALRQNLVKEDSTLVVLNSVDSPTPVNRSTSHRASPFPVGLVNRYVNQHDDDDDHYHCPDQLLNDHHHHVSVMPPSSDSSPFASAPTTLGEAEMTVRNDGGGGTVEELDVDDNYYLMTMEDGAGFMETTAAASALFPPPSQLQPHWENHNDPSLLLHHPKSLPNTTITKQLLDKQFDDIIINDPHSTSTNNLKDHPPLKPQQEPLQHSEHNHLNHILPNEAMTTR